MEVRPGARLGPYEILSPLGAGGMGEVWRARDHRLGRDVALKILPAEMLHDEERRRRFEREARSVARLSHPNVCAIHDVGRDGERDYLVLELLEGETLAQRLSAGPLPLGEVLRIGAQLASALAAAHALSIIHRDLKPGNVMLTGSGVKLLDFGLARSLAAHEPVDRAPLGSTASLDLTRPGATLGTAPYMSPEGRAVQRPPARRRKPPFIWSTGGKNRRRTI